MTSGMRPDAIAASCNAHRALMAHASDLAKEMRKRFEGMEAIKVVLILRQAALLIERGIK